MMTRRTARALIVLLSMAAGGSSEPAIASELLSVASPNGDLVISFALKANPQPYLPGERAYYSVNFRRQRVLTDSPLGLDFLDETPLDHDFGIVGTDRQSRSDTWENPFGVERIVRDHFNELKVSLRERQSPARRLDLVFRAYDGGVAFRYALPKQPGLDHITLSSEGTGFYFAQDAFAFALNLGSFTTPYESEFGRIPLDRIKPTSIIGLPLLVEIPGGPWVALLEADLRDYAGMYVAGAPGVANGLVAKLSPLPNHSDRAVEGSTPKATPWRLFLINSRPGGLIESSDLVLNLSAPSALEDTSWIKPGKVAWEWWSNRFARGVNFTPGINTATMKHYVDFAAAHHLEYMLIDAGWSTRGDITQWVPAVDLPDILAHARARGVRILVWMHWTDVNKQLELAFPLYEKWGVAGVKIDFMNRDDQEMVNFYERVVRLAAQHHLVVDFHGAFKPTGLRRAYPNLLTREGVMGMEYSKWSDRVTPEHDVTLPFTRMLAGPMDYTPGCFQNATREQFKPRHTEPMCQGTRAHQLAMYVVFESPLEMLSDYSESYDSQPGIEFLEKVPTVWDKTKVLSGEPARYITIARKRGGAWYLGSMTNWDPRDLTIPLDFLGPGNYEAEIFADGPDADKIATSVSITRRRVSSADHLTVHLAAGGGLAAILVPVRD